MIKGNVKIDRKNLISILQSCLVLILVILVALMMVEIGNLKGTARVINYAGLVRGDTQRAVKLEITGTRNDELIAYLDDILSNLTSGEGHYELVKLKDAAYQERLDSQRAYWERLKAEVAAARQRGYENTQIVAMSETYFEMADETVSAAEHYSEKIAMKIRTIEILSALDMLCLVILIMLQTAMALKMARKNQLLEQKAYIDIHTGLPNKGSCEELLNNREILREPTACVIFDLNNLKTVNDTRGHSAGDQLILSFARLLRRVIPEKHFVGRYGGDEFMAVIYHTDRQEVEGILDSLRREADAANRDGNQLPLSYARFGERHAGGAPLRPDVHPDSLCRLHLAVHRPWREQLHPHLRRSQPGARHHGHRPGGLGGLQCVVRAGARLGRGGQCPGHGARLGLLVFGGAAVLLPAQRRSHAAALARHAPELFHGSHHPRLRSAELLRAGGHGHRELRHQLPAGEIRGPDAHRR